LRCCGGGVGVLFWFWFWFCGVAAHAKEEVMEQRLVLHGAKGEEEEEEEAEEEGRKVRYDVRPSWRGRRHRRRRHTLAAVP
jgi:hypothetical protein